MSAALKVGVVLPLFSGEASKVRDAAMASEDLGYDGVFGFDHFFPPGGAGDRPSLEVFTTLAAVGARTSRVAVGTLVTRAILRDTGVLAKHAATIDQITGGRMILGVGTGDPIDRPEHRAFGYPDLPVRDRREHLEETLVALKALFEGKAYKGGRRVPPIDGPLVPPPIQAPGLPIWLGAQSDEVVRMAGRLADGWNVWGLSPEAFRKKADLLQEEASRSGRRVEATWAGIVLVGKDASETEALHRDRLRKGMDALSWAGPADAFVGFLNDLADAGAGWAIVVLAGPPDRRRLVAERVLPELGGI